MYPTSWEIYDNTESELIAEFKAIDEDTIIVTVKGTITGPEDLVELSKHLAEAYRQYTESDKEN